MRELSGGMRRRLLVARDAGVLLACALPMWRLAIWRLGDRLID